LNQNRPLRGAADNGRGRPTVAELHRDLREVMRAHRRDFDLSAPGLCEGLGPRQTRAVPRKARWRRGNPLYGGNRDWV